MIRAHSLIFGERCQQIAQVAHQKWAMWANCSGCSPKMSDHDQIAQVSHQKWGNEWISTDTVSVRLNDGFIVFYINQRIVEDRLTLVLDNSITCELYVMSNVMIILLRNTQSISGSRCVHFSLLVATAAWRDSRGHGSVFGKLRGWVESSAISQRGDVEAGPHRGHPRKSVQSPVRKTPEPCRGSSHPSFR